MKIKMPNKDVTILKSQGIFCIFLLEFLKF